jgi:hypothetical protein
MEALVITHTYTHTHTCVWAHPTPRLLPRQRHIVNLHILLYPRMTVYEREVGWGGDFKR